MPLYFQHELPKIARPIQRIVSTVPSQTELLFDLGLGDKIYGITKFCVHPKEKVRSVAKIGGTKNLRIKEIERIQPDLIIANKEENTRDQIEQLAQKFNVWVSDVSDFDKALEMIRSIGIITETSTRAQELANKIDRSFHPFVPESRKDRTVAYIIWNQPLMTVGGDTFIDSMLRKAGFSNIFSAQKRYPEINIDQLKQLRPDYIFLSSEPYPFKETHCIDFQRKLSDSKVILVDGEMFSWYGSRLLKAAPYFQQLLKTLDIH